MVHNNPWKSYKQVATQTANPGQLVLMLFEGAIRFLEQARAGFAFEDPCERNTRVNNNVIRAQAIINELNRSLDMRSGGDLAITLNKLYDYFDRKLTESNLKKEEVGIEEVIHRITILKDAWAQMLLQQCASATIPDMREELCALR